MKARVKATGDIWEFSQIDEITFKSAINGHLYCAEELEFLEPSVFTPDYWEKLKHQYAGMVIQGMFANPKLVDIETFTSIVCKANTIASELINKLKEESKCEK